MTVSRARRAVWPAPPAPSAPGARRRRGFGERIRAASGTTPGRHRLWSLAAGLLLVVALVATGATAARMRSTTRRTETRSGPILVSTQQLVSSLAEADAAASAAFLSGRDEDPEQRRLYEQALVRSGEQLQQIASLAGQDPAIQARIGGISTRLIQYAGLIEAARASNKVGASTASGYLVAAVRLADEIVQGDLQALTEVTQANLRRDGGSRTNGFLLAALALVAGLVLLGAGQAAVAAASRRLLNAPLVVATVLVLAALGWLAVASHRSGSALARASSHGYDSIVLVARLDNAGFGAKAAETLAVITGDPAQRAEADADAHKVAASAITPTVVVLLRRGGTSGPAGGLIGQVAMAADTARERAAVAETGERWQRYEDTVAALRSAPNAAAARSIAVGQANADFNGFNFSVESILGQNREQFVTGLTSAARQSSAVPAGVVLLLLVALGASFAGFQLRINEYH